MLQIRETKKLFYDEYPYKLVVRNALTHIFRERNYRSAQIALDDLQLKYEKGEPLSTGTFRVYTYEVETFLECKMLYEEFVKSEDFKIRVENPLIQIYSHNKPWLSQLSKKVRDATELWSPHSVIAKNTIIVDSPVVYSYKITMGSRVDPALGKWIVNNPNKAKIGSVALREICNRGFVKGMYFYVRDEKILNLVNLMLGKTCRVDKLIYKQDLDK